MSKNNFVVEVTFKGCPRNVQGSNSKVTLFMQEVQKCYVQNFLGETLNLAVLDSG